MSALREVSLLNCSTVIPHLTLCNSLAFVRTWPLRLPVCVSLFVFVCVFLTLIFSAASLPLILCWHGERAAGSLHSNLPSFVITCPCDTKTRTHTRTHTHTHARTPVTLRRARTHPHPHTAYFLRHANTGDPVTAFSASPSLCTAICDLNKWDGFRSKFTLFSENLPLWPLQKWIMPHYRSTHHFILFLGCLSPT